MSEPLKRCPYCDCKTEVDVNSAQLVCLKCGLAGPAVSGQGDDCTAAIAAWNALPRRLRWTREKPTEEGWYWYRDKVTEPIMSLITTLDHKLVMNAYRRYQNALIDRLDGEYDEEWAGPIPEPEDA